MRLGMRLGKQAGKHKANHPHAWALGEELAASFLASRSRDLVRMIHEQGKQGIELYVRETSEAAVRGVADGEVEMNEPVTQEALTAVGISCGIALRDGLDREARGL
jgi:hypothetical protein